MKLERLVQPAILKPIPHQACYLSFSLKPGADYRAALKNLAPQVDGSSIVLGIGLSLVNALGNQIEGLRLFPAMVNQGIEIPSTPEALWLWFRGRDRGQIVLNANRLIGELSPAFRLEKRIESFKYGNAQDLTGYEDGTENPVGDEAVQAAVVTEGELTGSSFVAVQQWVHDLAQFQSKSPQQRDNTFGRRISDNEEIDEAPESAHVKRTAQESFNPEAFMVRRSMPWSEGDKLGLVFTAFGHSFDAYEAVLKRMVGKEDGVTDALFTFTHPISGSYYWCPPMKGHHVDLSALGID
ncbi:Dyp-type peroxidase [Thiomicrorhabdus sp. ZW0627]|uniref:Dyp-type peroxidase n=1 Tax=Thiomicrorhabdus sp. ZW0627 TaxID=3039774 RepID=UPI002436751A|nr:Dyp-type peroxidase [Thiomicrorhabdus sp. ZW0627]MDG6774265.1 Dyp-type peroxidase [Thiomicrorhabdus sp. ZW0627]